MARKLESITLPVIDSDYFCLFNTGDWHKGNACHREDVAEAFCDDVLSCQYPRGVFFMGDMLESIPPTDKRFDLESIQVDKNGMPMDCTSQLFDLVQTTSRISQYILGYHMGNHEAKLHRLGHRVLAEYAGYMRHENGWQGKFLGDEADIKIEILTNSKTAKAKRKKLYISSKHGAGGATVISTKMKKLADFLKSREFIQDDGKLHPTQAVYMGHIHDLIVRCQTDFSPNYETRKMEAIKRYLVATGSLMDTSQYDKENYAIAKGYNPLPIGWTKTIVDRDGVIQDVEIKHAN